MKEFENIHDIQAGFPSGKESNQTCVSFQEAINALFKDSEDQPGGVIQIGCFSTDISERIANICLQQGREFHIIDQDKNNLEKIKKRFDGIPLSLSPSFHCEDFFYYACEPGNYQDKIFLVLIDGYRSHDDIIKDCVTLRVMAERIKYAVFSHFYSRHISLDVRTNEAVSEILGTDIPFHPIGDNPGKKLDIKEKLSNNYHDSVRSSEPINCEGILLNFSKMRPYPKKKLFLHVGNGKCGSTTIQFFLAKNREILKRFGYIYPGSSENHYHGGNLSKYDLEIHGFSDNLKLFRDYLYEALAAESTTCILSGENFVDDPHISERFFPCKIFFDCKILLYIRNIVSHTESRFQQNVVIIPHYFFSNISYPQQIYPIKPFLKQINNWISMFGRKAVSIHDFDSVINHKGLINDLLQWIELSPHYSDFVQVPSQNISLTYQYFHFLLHCYLLPLPNIQREELIQSLINLSQEDEKHERYLFIPKKFYKEMLTRFSEDYKKIGELLNNPDWISDSYEYLANLKQAPINLKAELQHEIFQKLPLSLQEAIGEIWPQARTRNLYEPLLPCMSFDDNYTQVIHSWGKEYWKISQYNELDPTQLKNIIRDLKMNQKGLVQANKNISNALKIQKKEFLHENQKKENLINQLNHDYSSLENSFNVLMGNYRFLNKKVRQIMNIPLIKEVFDLIILLSDTIGLKKDITSITNSVFFDHGWYLEQNPDVASTGISPIVHYCKFGWIEGRNPGPLFNTNNYLKRYPDVASAGVNPLVHFERFGKNEERIFE